MVDEIRVGACQCSSVPARRCASLLCLHSGRFAVPRALSVVVDGWLGGAFSGADPALIFPQAVVNLRKGRKIVGYELDITLNWEGKIEDGEGGEAVKSTGTIRFPEVCEEVEDMNFKVCSVVSANSPVHPTDPTAHVVVRSQRVCAISYISLWWCKCPVCVCTFFVCVLCHGPLAALLITCAWRVLRVSHESCVFPQWETTVKGRTPGDQRLRDAVNHESSEIREILRKWVAELSEQ